jgi:hypothetical protein
MSCNSSRRCSAVRPPLMLGVALLLRSTEQVSQLRV